MRAKCAAPQREPYRRTPSAPCPSSPWRGFSSGRETGSDWPRWLRRGGKKNTLSRWRMKTCSRGGFLGQLYAPSPLPASQTLAGRGGGGLSPGPARKLPLRHHEAGGSGPTPGTAAPRGRLRAAGLRTAPVVKRRRRKQEWNFHHV